MTFEQIYKSLQNKQFSPLYLFHGEEPYFIDQLVDYIQENALTPMEREFNQMVYYGKDASAEQVISFAKQYPMMASKRVVILREAQDMRGFATLEPYFDNVVQSTIFVIAFKNKKIDSRTKIGKKIAQNAVVFESKKIQEYKLSGWIINKARELGLAIDSKAADLLTFMLGTDLGKIENELKKFKISDVKNIGIEDIKQNISLSREYSVFELSNALGEKDMSKVFTMMTVFEQNPKQYPIQVFIGSLFAFFVKVSIVKQNFRSSDKALMGLAGIGHLFFVKQFKKAASKYSSKELNNVFKVLNEYDAKSKGIGARTYSGVELLKEMCLRILG